MSKNYEVVTLILKDPKLIPVWINENKIVIEDIKIAMDYIKDQNLLSEDDFTKKLEYLQQCTSFYHSLVTLSKSGKSNQEIREICEKAFNKKVE